MKDPAFVDRAAELGVLTVLRALANSLAGDFSDAVPCECGARALSPRNPDASEPHDRTCGMHRLVLLFVTKPEALAKFVDEAHNYAQWAEHVASEPEFQNYGDVVRAMRLLGRKP